MGSIDKRSDGRYRARWREADGRQRSKHFQKKVDAQRFLATVVVEQSEGRYIAVEAGRVTLRAYSAQWVAGQVWRPSTHERMAHVLEHYVLPEFGDRELRQIRASEVQSWVARMSTRLAPSTVEAYYRVLAALMISARRDRLIHTTPCEAIRLPRRASTGASLVPLTVEQVHAIAETVPGHYRALVLVSAGLGLRQGEACGLSVDRVDFLRRTVKIDRQLLSPARSGACYLGPPKTPSSNRVLPLPTSVAEVLARHLELYPTTDEDGLIFQSSTGARLRRSTWADAFGAAARAVGVQASPHDLRHHSASLLIGAGCSIKAVQHFLGHATAAETLDTYAHLWPDDEHRIRDAIDGGLRRSEDFLRTNGVPTAISGT
jgi:integrase